MPALATIPLAPRSASSALLAFASENGVALLIAFGPVATGRRGDSEAPGGAGRSPPHLTERRKKNSGGLRPRRHGGPSPVRDLQRREVRAGDRPADSSRPGPPASVWSRRAGPLHLSGTACRKRCRRS